MHNVQIIHHVLRDPTEADYQRHMQFPSRCEDPNIPSLDHTYESILASEIGQLVHKDRNQAAIDKVEIHHNHQESKCLPPMHCACPLQEKNGCQSSLLQEALVAIVQKGSNFFKKLL